MTSPASASAVPTNLSGFLNGGSGSAAKNQGISVDSFLASLAVSFAVFGAEFGIFLLINRKLKENIMLMSLSQPRTFLVPERERTRPPPKGLLQWIQPVFRTSNSEFIHKCGLDAYFFLRYLRTLLKIFVPMALVILPILLPLNAIHGRGSNFVQGPYADGNYKNVGGMDTLGWGNVKPTKNHRYWAHLILGVGVVIWACFVFFDELRGYIRLRQAYLTSPQHRLRASATTVLVTAIPPKWCTFEALNGLYDVFPGGIRNIWINRNFDDLNDKVKLRDSLASQLEAAETNLIRNAKKAYVKKAEADAKAYGQKSKKKGESELKARNDQSLGAAQTDGISAGDPHQIQHTLQEVLGEVSEEPSREPSPERKKPLVPIPVIGQGIEAVGHGLGVVGRNVFGTFRRVEKGVDQRLDTTEGFVPAASEPVLVESRDRPRKMDFGIDETLSSSVSPDPTSHHPAHDATTSSHQQTTGGGKLNDGNVPQRVSQDGSMTFDNTPNNQDLHRPTIHSDVIQNPERIGDDVEGNASILKFWKKGKVPYGIPSPVPHGLEEDEFPLSQQSPLTPNCNPQATVNGKTAQQESRYLDQPAAKDSKKTNKDKKKQETLYQSAYNKDYDPNSDNPRWRDYLTDKDRETMRLPVFGWQWMISLPLLGKKVDTINYCRKEVARLNMEIEKDQKEPEKFSLMNSAFVQFNHQVAAHMACQAVSHHTPNQMAPRVVEISPDDVIWDNMSIKWWEVYIRTGGVIILVCALVVGWTVPVTFTGLLSNAVYLNSVSWLKWLNKIPTSVLSIIQGVLPPTALAILLFLLPLILRFLSKAQGDFTGMSVELSVQSYYFAFLFIQVFLVVSISSGITTILPELAQNPGNIPSILADNLPKASNYFFSYMLLQAFSVSGGSLVQIVSLLEWFLLAPMLDSTARQKWKRQINLPNVQWGTFFPVYTNLACIGLIYSVISPLIMVFNIITFSLFWVVYRYNTLYVTKFRFDTGGLLYPRAINQLFTGLFFMELCMGGLFLLVRDVEIVDGKAQAVGQPCRPQAIIMFVLVGLTAIYQFLLNLAFGPLIRYLPITLEDEAVMRDEEFARAQEKRWALEDNEQDGKLVSNMAKELNQRDAAEEQQAENIELANLDPEPRREYHRLDPRNLGNLGAVPEKIGHLVPITTSWADRSRNKQAMSPTSPAQQQLVSPRHRRRRHSARKPQKDIESQLTSTEAIGEALFSGINDEIEDLTPDERDKLVQRAFQHEALRARRPVIWIPRDEMGVSDDEILRTQKFSGQIWISNEHTALDEKGRVIFRKSPPDFSELDLIEL